MTTTPLGRNGDGNVVFTVTGISGSTSCTATEPTTPTGYTKNETTCASVALCCQWHCVLHDHQHAELGHVHRHQGLQPDNAGTAVSFALSCGANGTVTTTPLGRNGDGNVVFTVTGISRQHFLHGDRADDSQRLHQERDQLRQRRPERQRLGLLHDHQHAELRHLHGHQGLPVPDNGGTAVSFA